MRIEPTQTTAEEAQTALRRSLGFQVRGQAGRSVGPELCAEALRSALWSLWSSDRQPVYVTRLLGAANRMLLPWRSDSDEENKTIQERMRTTLQELEVLGDLASLPNGRWAPAPSRLVRFPAIERYLILSGTPSRLFSNEVKNATIRNGVARLIESRHPRVVDLQAPELPLEEWLRLPLESLSDWTRAVLGSTNLEPAGELQVDVYAPALAATSNGQYFHWKSVSPSVTDGLYVARSRIRRGSMAYYIVQITGGRLVAIGTPNLGNGDVRRLMYGIDMLCNRPVRVVAQRNRTRCSFKLGSGLPRAEHRQFMTLGEERLPTNGRYYPRWWDVPLDYVPEAERALQNLGIEVDMR